MNNAGKIHRCCQKHIANHSLTGMLAMLLLIPVKSLAQTEASINRLTTTQGYQIGLGSTNTLDTYLTPERFSGWGVTVLSTTERQRQHASWSTLIEHQLHLSKGSDRAENDSELEGSYNLYIGRLHSWQLLNGDLCLQGGGMANLCMGFIYNMRNNANNPAQARFAINVMPTCIATWRPPLSKRRLALRYELQLPLIGIMFSPNYGQSYYELFTQGNYDHNIVPTTFVSAPTFRQQFLFLWKAFPHTTLSLGYLGDIEQTQVNNLKQHVWSNRLMMGMSWKFEKIKK